VMWGRAFVVLTVAVVLLTGVAARQKREPYKMLPVHSHRTANGTLLGFDQTQALRYLYYAYAAYQTTAVFPWGCSYCTAYGPASSFVTVGTFGDAADAFGFVGYNSDYREIVVSFRGSQTLSNWIANLQLSKDRDAFPGGSGGVHSGFLSYYNSVKDEMLDLLADVAGQAQYQSYTIFVTGHSLGGAAALICALDLRVNQGYNNVYPITFGEPRVGDSTFANWANSVLGNVVRVTNGDDIVVHLPPSFWPFSFQHETQEIWANNGAYRVCSSSNGEDGSCADSVPLYEFSVTDHLNYMGVNCCKGPNAAITLPEHVGLFPDPDPTGHN